MRPPSKQAPPHSRVRKPRTRGSGGLATESRIPDDARDTVIDVARPRRVRRLRLWTLDWYIIKSFLAAYVVCAVSFTGLYIAVEIFTKMHRFIRGSSEGPLDLAWSFVSNVAMYHFAMVPTIYVNYMGPILTLSAAMFSLTFLNRGNEFTPMRAAGVSLYRVLVPIFLLAACFTGVSFALQEYVIPEMREPIRRALAVSRSGALRPPTFYDRPHELHIDVARYSPDRKYAQSVTVSRWHSDGGAAGDNRKLHFFIDAEEMVWQPGPDSTPRHETGHWVLRNGAIQRWEGEWKGKILASQAEESRNRLKEPFETMKLESSLLPIDLETSDQDISYLSWRELKTQYERQPEHRHLLARLHHHFAFPLSHIVLLLLGLPFVLNFKSRSFFLSLAVSFFLCAGYFLVGSLALNMANDPGKLYNLPPVIASWLPNILFGALGLTIFTNMRS